MKEDIKEIATETINGVVAEVANAMRDAVNEHGAEAVDLAMLAYQVSAIQSLVFGAVFMAIIVGLVLGYKWLWSKSDDMEKHDKPIILGVSGILALVTGFIFVLPAADIIFNIPNWFAAFGNPELLIATKALEAAGLL